MTKEVEVVANGSDDPRAVVTKGSGDLGKPLCSATNGCSKVRSSMRLLNLWLPIEVE